MNRKRIGCWILALACATAALIAAQDDDATARAQVLGLEKTWNQAYKSGDTKALAAILDNSLVLVEDDGSLKTKSEFLATVKASTGNQEQVAPTCTVRLRSMRSFMRMAKWAPFAS